VTEADRAANVLGALALAVADQLSASAGRAGVSGSAGAALSALYHFLDRPTLEQLSRVLGLTHSAVVRLVDRLASTGLITRGPGDDRRSRTISLTPQGRDVARTIEAARADALNAAIAGFSAEELRQLHSLTGRVMANIVQSKDGGAWICRLCDLEACDRASGHCPTANAAAAKYGRPQ
jgi:DNA-binding MarR family transcriptional regulator